MRRATYAETESAESRKTAQVRGFSRGATHAQNAETAPTLGISGGGKKQDVTSAVSYVVGDDGLEPPTYAL